MRLVLALLVVVSHSAELVDGNRSREILTRAFHTISFGEFAVDGFFLLSGYLIVQSWESRPEAWAFLRKRILRIYPGYGVAAILCAVVVGPWAAPAAQYWAEFNVYGFMRSSLLLGSPAVPAVFAGSHYPVVNGAMWTIHYEFLCYLGVIAAGLAGVVRRPRIWFAVTIVVLALAAAYRSGLVLRLPVSGLDNGNPIFRLGAFFLTGGSFYLLRSRLRLSDHLAAVCFCVAFVGMFSPGLAELSLATAGGYVLFWAARLDIPVLLRFNRLPDVSYGVYLYAWPVQKLIIQCWPTVSPWTLLPATVATSVLLGAISWFVVEKPFIRLKPADRQRTLSSVGSA